MLGGGLKSHGWLQSHRGGEREICLSVCICERNCTESEILSGLRCERERMVVVFVRESGGGGGGVGVGVCKRERTVVFDRWCLRERREF